MEKPKDRTTTSEMQGQLPGGVLEKLAREGARQVVRNGYLSARQLVTEIGPVEIRHRGWMIGY